MIEAGRRSSSSRHGDFGILARGTAISFLGEANRVFVQYIYGIIVARLAGVSAFGIYFLALTIFNFMGIFTYRAQEDALMRYMGRYGLKGEQARVKGLIYGSFLLSFTVSIAAGLLCFLFAVPLAERVAGKPDLGRVLRWLSVGIPLFTVMQMSVAVMRGLRNVKPFVLIARFMLPIVNVLLAFLALWFGTGLQGVSYAYVSAIFCAACVAILVLHRFMRQFRHLAPALPDVRGYLGFVMAFIVIQVSAFLFLNCDALLIGAFRPDAELGVYMGAKKTAMILNLLHLSMIAIFVPMVSHCHGDNERSQLAYVFKTSAAWMLILGTPVYLIMVIFGGEILSLFGPAFLEGRTALLILATGFWLHISVGGSGYLLALAGHQKLMAVTSVILAVSVFVGIRWVIPEWGILGAAGTMCVFIILGNVFVLTMIHRLLGGLHPFTGRYARVLGCGVVSLVLVAGIRKLMPWDGNVIVTLSEIAVLLVIFGVLILRFGLESEEKALISSLWMRLRRRA